MTALWILYWRRHADDKRRERFMSFHDEGEACANLCYAVLHYPGKDWKLRKVRVAQEDACLSRS
jgi:hypothetical protein